MENKIAEVSALAVTEKEKLASRLFRKGYNCAQAVFAAFAEEMGMDELEAVRLASAFGGGMGRMREVCGAMSAALLVLGKLDGYTDTTDHSVKKRYYARIQALMGRFRDEMGSYVCRELLGVKGAESPEPAIRDEAYYASRPCEKCCMAAARLIEEEIINQPRQNV